MIFDVTADAYARFMGRYSEPLAVQFAEFADVRPGQRALDVGCGPGALTSELARRLGTSAVCAVEPSESFAAAARERLPGVDVQVAKAERLPFPDDAFDVAMAQLVVHFMADPVAGLREMARVTRPGGLVAACAWDYGGGRAPMTTFWRAARELDPSASGGSGRPGTSEAGLISLFEQAGLRGPETIALTVEVRYESFDQWWEPFTLGVGPTGAYLESLPEARRADLREHCRTLVPAGPVEVSATAWAGRARA